MYIVFYLIHYNPIPPLRVGAHKRQEKKQERKTWEKTKKYKGIEAQRAKPPTQTQAIDVLIGDKKQRKRKKQEVGSKPSYPIPFGHLLQYAWFIRSAYSETPAHREKNIIIGIISRRAALKATYQRGR